MFNEPLIHLTLNSGKSSHPSSKVFVPELAQVIRPFLDNCGGTFPRPYDAYRIETDVTETGVAFEYYKNETPISICVGTWAGEFAEEYWTEIETAFYQVTDVFPKRVMGQTPTQSARLFTVVGNAAPAWIFCEGEVR